MTIPDNMRHWENLTDLVLAEPEENREAMILKLANGDHKEAENIRVCVRQREKTGDR